MPVSPEPLPADWRERFVAMVRGEVPLDGSWFTGGPGCTPVEQVAIYSEQYRFRLGDAVWDDLPGLRALAGDGLGDWIHRYLRAHPSRTWTLNRVADALPEWLADEGADPAWCDMARVDRAVQRGFEARDPRPLGPDAWSAGRVRLAPPTALLRLDWNVHAIRTAVLTGQPPPPLRHEPVLLLLYRPERHMRHRVLSPPLFAILEALAAGAPLADAVAAPVSAGLVDAATLAPALQGWFHELAAGRAVEPA